MFFLLLVVYWCGPGWRGWWWFRVEVIGGGSLGQCGCFGGGFKGGEVYMGVRGDGLGYSF